MLIRECLVFETSIVRKKNSWSAGSVIQEVLNSNMLNSTMYVLIEFHIF